MDSGKTNTTTTAADGISTVLRTALDAVYTVVENDYKRNGKYAMHTDASVIKTESMNSRLKAFEQVTGVGFMSEISGERPNIPTDSGKTGNYYVVTPREWAMAIEVPRTFQADDQHNVTAQVQKTAESKFHTREKETFAIYRDAFAGSIFKTPDGQPIASNSHVSLKDGSTRDNLETGVFNETNLKSYLNTFETMKDDVGFQGGFLADTLFVAPAKYADALVVTKTELRPRTNYNDLNYVSMTYPGLVVKTNPYIAAAQGGSDTMWALLSNRHRLTRITRDEWEVYSSWEDAVKAKQAPVSTVTFGHRESYVAHDFYGTLFSNGTVS